MAKLPNVHCRICKKAIDRNVTQKDVDWVMPSRNFYYHKSCYENWRQDKTNVQANKNDEEWISYIYDFLARDLVVSYNYVKCDSQRKNFIKKYHYTNKGIFFSLKYYYEIKKNDWKNSEGGIGIVPYIYQDACLYWEEQYLKQKDILSTIETQLRNRAQRERISIKHKKPQQIRYKSMIDEIGDMDDE